MPTLTPDDDDARAHMKYYELKANYEVLMGTYKNSFWFSDANCIILILILTIFRKVQHPKGKTWKN